MRLLIAIVSIILGPTQLGSAQVGSSIGTATGAARALLGTPTLAR
jgi:hypothetical protein